MSRYHLLQARGQGASHREQRRASHRSLVMNLELYDIWASPPMIHHSPCLCYDCDFGFAYALQRLRTETFDCHDFRASVPALLCRHRDHHLCG